MWELNEALACTPGDRWLSIADRHPNLLPHRCGPIQRGADRLKIQNLPTRRMYLRVSADPSETTASRHFNLSLPVLLSVSRREFLQSPAANSLHEWLGNTFGCAVAILTLSRKSWIPGLARFPGFAQAGGWRARELRACAEVILVRARGSQPPPPYCKKNAGTFAKKCRHYTLHRCTKM